MIKIFFRKSLIFFIKSIEIMNLFCERKGFLFTQLGLKMS